MNEKLTPFSFKRYVIENGSGNFNHIKIWKRKTWNTNIAIALISFPKSDKNTGEYAKKIKSELGKEIGYKVFLYPLGLQIVFFGNDILKFTKNLDKYVDKIDTQTVVLQSIFVVDISSRTYRSTRTWGQVFTGKFQDAIEESIKIYLNKVTASNR